MSVSVEIHEYKEVKRTKNMLEEKKRMKNRDMIRNKRGHVEITEDKRV